MTQITTVTTICDECGEEIDTTRPYFHVTDPSQVADPGKDYHPEHAPSLPPTPEQLPT